MDDFEKKNRDESQPRPDYYHPNNNNSSQYNPPQSEKPVEENTTYHYSYTNPNSQQAQQNNNGNYYTPPQNDYSGASYNPVGNYNDNKPPKKNKAAIIIIVVLVVCLVIAGIGLAIGAAGNMSDNDNSTNQSQSSDESNATLSNSEDAPLTDKDNNYTVAGVAKAAMDSCVGITVYSEQASSFNYFYGYGNNNNANSDPTKSGEGSGVLMSESNGKTYILTCAHVITDGDNFKVTLNDGTEVDAYMVGVDAQTDIGVLSINQTGLKIADFANSDNLVVGEQVVAIGCPGGLEFINSLTSGYISALARPISSSIGYDNECIQIDAAINPGNSGGALFNMQGQVIGINSSKIAATEYEGMGFAVPTKTAVETANSLIKVGYVEGRAKIGISYSPITNYNNSATIIDALADKGYKDAQGAMVISEVNEGSDLKNKDIKQYDMIIAVNGETLTSTDIMTSVLSDSKPGDTIKLTIARIENNDIQIKEVDCKLIESKG